MNRMEKNRIGVCQWCLRDQSPDGAEMVRKMGFDGVQMDMGLGSLQRDLRRPGFAAAYAAAWKREGLQVSSLALNNLDAHDEAAAAQAEQNCLQAMEAAVCLKAPVLMIPCFGPSGMETEADFARIADLLRRVCIRAGEYDLVVSSENSLSGEDNLRLLEAVDRPNFRIYFDTANPLMMRGLDGLAMLEMLLPHICEVHIKDFRRNKEWENVCLGQGDCRARQALELLRSRDYQGWLVVENDTAERIPEPDTIWLRQGLA